MKQDLNSFACWAARPRPTW